MKSSIPLTTFLGSVLFIGAAPAQEHEIVHEPPTYKTEYVYAKVTRVNPYFEYHTRTSPVRECWDEPVATKGHRHPGRHLGGALAGGILGGIVGHQFGDGRGRDLSTALGTVIGAQVGYDNARHADYSGGIEYQQVCSTTVKEQGFDVVQDGYQVSYRYLGEDYHARLPYDPGDRIKLKVRVRQ